MSTDNDTESNKSNPRINNEPLTLTLEIDSIESTTELPDANKNFQNREHEMNNACRLCMTEEIWIDVFSSEPYEDSGEIIPSNILEVIEQFTTVKVNPP